MMPWGHAYGQGLTIKKNLRFIPDCYNDDQGKFITVSFAAKESGIHRTTIIKKIKRNKKLGAKINGSWWIRLKLFQKIIEEYRYNPLKTTRNGKWWKKAELDILSSGVPIKEMVSALNRSYRSVVTKKSKIK